MRVRELTIIELERCFKALADRTRLRIVSLLMHGELCGCDIQYVIETSQSNVSRHLTYLKNAGLVDDRREGSRVFYRLSERLKRNRRLLELLRSSFSEDASLTVDLQRLKRAVKNGACTVSEFQPYAELTKLTIHQSHP